MLSGFSFITGLTNVSSTRLGGCSAVRITYNFNISVEVAQMTKSNSGVIVEFSRFEQSIRFFIDQPDESIQRHIFSGRFYEEEDLDAISKHMREPNVIIDVGANIGNHSIYLGSRFSNATICPVEMFPEVLKLLKINLLLNPHVKIDSRGLGVGLSSERKNCGISARFKENRGLVRVDFEADDKHVQLLPGDELLDGLVPDLIKIDVEGHELEVLRGMNSLIQQTRPTIFIEVDNKNEVAFHEWRQTNNYSVIERIRRYVANENFLIVPN